MGTTAKCRRRIPALAFTVFILFSVTAAAEDSPRDAENISVGDRAEAADAYDQGTSAYLSKHYELAAHWFERAYRLVPTSAALLQSVRAHYKAGNSMQAANLAVELRDTYPANERSRQVVDLVLTPVKPVSVLVQAHCTEECTLELDGALIPHATFFVTPDVEHALKAAFRDGESSTLVQGSPGDTKEAILRPPAPIPPPPVPRWAFLSSLGATVALGAVTVWSGVDTRNGVGAYESAARSANSPGINNGGSVTPQEQAQSLLEDGHDKERRTNILIGVTAGMAATTIVLGVFTNWKGESRKASSRRIEPSVGASRQGGALAIKGRF